jgi:hypothetical protein
VTQPVQEVNTKPKLQTSTVHSRHILLQPDQIEEFFPQFNSMSLWRYVTHQTNTITNYDNQKKNNHPSILD